MVRAEGLLQLTYMDADRYGCNFDWEKDKDLPHNDPAKTILQPKNNLTCGVKILDDQLIARHERLLSPSSYWETLRPGTLGYKVFRPTDDECAGVLPHFPGGINEMKEQPAPATLAQDEARKIGYRVRHDAALLASRYFTPAGIDSLSRTHRAAPACAGFREGSRCAAPARRAPPESASVLV